jgi:hypothetical protein
MPPKIGSVATQVIRPLGEALAGGAKKASGSLQKNLPRAADQSVLGKLAATPSKIPRLATSQSRFGASLPTNGSSRFGNPGGAALNGGSGSTGVGAFMQQMAGSALNLAAGTASPIAAPILQAASNAFNPTPPIGGDGNNTINQMNQQANQSTQDQMAMANIQNRATMASMMVNLSETLTGALASVGNKGASNIDKAASGQ